MVRKLIDLTGEQFGYWKVLKRGEDRVYYYRKIPRWECECICGKIKLVDGNNLRSGHSKSCGCKKKSILTETIHE